MPPEANDPNAQAQTQTNDGATTEPQPDPLAGIDDRINRAFSAREKRLLDSFNKSLDERLKSLAPAASPPPAAETGKTVDPALAKLREELDAHKRELETERRTRRETEERSRAERTDAALRDVLRAKGVRPELLPGAFHTLRATALRFEEDGTARLAISRSRERGRAAEEVAFSIEEGVADWLKSDEAKAYLPPPAAPPKPQTQGSVARPLGVDGKPRAMSREEAIDASLAQADRARSS